jgi:hypothetical protein
VANLTISVDDQLLKRARMKALEEGTSVNALLREYLEVYTGAERAQHALAGFAELAQQSEAGSGPAGRTWTRDGIHDRTALP